MGFVEFFPKAHLSFTTGGLCSRPVCNPTANT
jgi:hypothetical protein